MSNNSDSLAPLSLPRLVLFCCTSQPVHLVGSHMKSRMLTMAQAESLSMLLCKGIPFCARMRTLFLSSGHHFDHRHSSSDFGPMLGTPETPCSSEASQREPRRNPTGYDYHASLILPSHHSQSDQASNLALNFSLQMPTPLPSGYFEIIDRCTSALLPAILTTNKLKQHNAVRGRNLKHKRKESILFVNI